MTQQLDTALVPEWTLGDRLRKARELTGLDAIQFADEIGVHRDTVANYEKNKTSHPRRIVLDAWARRSGVSLQWLAGDSFRRPTPRVTSQSSRQYTTSTRPDYAFAGNFVDELAAVA